MTKYYLGLDGGGSKTHGALFSRDGRLVDFIEWGTTSHEFLTGGYSGLKIELKRMFGSIQSRNGLHWEDVSCVYGLAGVDCEKQSALIGGYIRECGVSSCLLCNDSLLGIKAASETGWGICSVNGSGTGASGIDINCRVHTVGGLFGLSGDYAGGRVLGSETVRLVYEQLFRGGEYTVLSDMLFEKLGVKDCRSWKELLVSGIADHTIEPKAFAPLMFEAACKGDNAALKVLSDCGRQCSRDIIAVAKELTFPENTAIPVVLLGSLYTKAKHPGIIESLQSALSRSAFKFDLIKLSCEPVAGAVFWAMEKDGIEYSREDISKQITVSLENRH